MSTSLRSLALLTPALLALACGGPTPEEQGKKPPARSGSRYDKPPVAADSAPAAAEAGAEGAGAEAADAFDEDEGAADDWESAEDEAAADGDTDDGVADADAEGGAEDADEAGDAAAEGGEDAGADATPHAGPCKVTWTSGTVVRFEYDEDEKGGKAKVDADGDGKSDVCADFSLEDGRTSKVSVKQDCKGKADFTITPKYAKDTNVATAKLSEAGGDNRDITLVALPSFSGVAPGYPLHAPKKKAKLTDRDGLIRTAKITEPSEGPPIDVKFFYDDKGRIKTIKEDHGIDGTTDQKYTYRYDGAGNVTRVTLSVMQPDGTVKKTTAKLDYSCWPEE